MKNKPSIQSYLLFILFLIAFISVGTTGVLWILSVNSRFETEVNTLKADFVAQKKHLIESDVKRIAYLISFQRNLEERNLRREMEIQTLNVAKNVDQIYKDIQDSESVISAKERVLKMIGVMVPNNRNAVIFVVDEKGAAFLSGTAYGRFDTVNSGKIFLQDTSGIGRNLVRLKQSGGEGFFNFKIKKWLNDPPNSGIDTIGMHHLVYIKKCKTVPWCVGVDENFSLFEDDLKKRICGEIDQIKPEEAEYFFIGQWDGISLAGPAKGKNMISITDANGLKIVQELIKVAQKGGGFVEYVMPNIDGKASKPKISFALPVIDWQWYVGSGVYLDDIQNTIDLKRKELDRKIFQSIVKSGGIFLVVLVLIAMLVGITSRHMKRTLQSFSYFFKQAASKHESIDRQKIYYREFDSIAESADEMIAARLKAENDLRESEEKYRLLLSNIPDVTWIASESGTIQFMSPVVEWVCGYTFEELVREQIQNRIDVIHPEDRDRFSVAWKKLFIDGIYDVEFRVRHRSGKWIWVHDKAFHTFSQNGNLYAHGIFSDISHRKELEERLRQSEKMEAIGQLAGGVAHDFNNQLTGILGFADILYQESKDRPVLLEYSEKIIKASLRAADLTAKLLAFARKGKYIPTVIDLHIVIDEVVSFLNHSIDKRITLNTFHGAVTPFVHGDQSQLENALLNIAINARDAMPNGGELRISTEQVSLEGASCRQGAFEVEPGTYIAIHVSDNGTGMDEDTLKHIFEPFFTTKEQGKGTGLGLAAVYGIVKNHRGLISVSSNLGKGTTFSLFFPKVKSKENKKPLVHPNTNKGNVNAVLILIDDDSVVLQVTTEILAKSGFTVLSFNSSRSGIEKFREMHNSIDLVILDMIMPDLSGKEAFEELRKIDPAARVLLSSGYSLDKEAQSILDNGGVGFIQKPFRMAELVRTVLQALNATTGSVKVEGSSEKVAF